MFATYSIVVPNAGPSDVVDAVVEVLFPAEFTGCQSTCAAGTGASCVGTPVNGNLSDMPDPNGNNNSATDTDLGPDIFDDGFESGDTRAWSSSVGSVKRLGFARHPGHELRLAFEVDLSQAGRSSVIGLGHRGQPVIRLDLAVQPGELLLTMATRLDDGSWAVADPVLLTGHGQLELEWRRAWRPGTDNGELYLTARGATVVWLVDLDNDEQAVREVVNVGNLEVRRIE